jgi:hypothetical protein
MAYRFVRARPLRQRLIELRERLESGDVEQMEPFGQAMTKALQNARFDPETGEAVWIEEVTVHRRWRWNVRKSSTSTLRRSPSLTRALTKRMDGNASRISPDCGAKSLIQHRTSHTLCRVSRESEIDGSNVNTPESVTESLTRLSLPTNVFCISSGDSYYTPFLKTPFTRVPTARRRRGV